MSLGQIGSGGWVGSSGLLDSPTHPNEVEIKRLQKRVEELSMVEPTVENKNEFLAASKLLDDLLLK